MGEITTGYAYAPEGPDPYSHYRSVRWLGTDIPRTNFDPDLRFSFGALMTIFQVTRNNAEERVRAMARNGWRPPGGGAGAGVEDGEQRVDLEELAHDELASLIIRKFQGHGLARLVEAVLEAQGYTTYRSPEGADQGIDILAAPGPLGFGEPRLCVQVKSGEGPVDTSVLHQLIGAMQNVNAREGLLVSWGGFRRSVLREEPAQFFRVRLWNQQSLVDAIVENYDRLDEAVRAELPLKKIWIVAREPSGEEAGSTS